MMNLDLLFTVSKWTGDNKYKDVAIKHAITTMKNHFRPDYTCWHVVSYNNDGTVERKQTHQGKNERFFMVARTGLGCIRIHFLLPRNK